MGNHWILKLFSDILRATEELPQPTGHTDLQQLTATQALLNMRPQGKIDGSLYHFTLFLKVREVFLPHQVLSVPTI